MAATVLGIAVGIVQIYVRHGIYGAGAEPLLVGGVGSGQHIGVPAKKPWSLFHQTLHPLKTGPDVPVRKEQGAILEYLLWSVPKSTGRLVVHGVGHGSVLCVQLGQLPPEGGPAGHADAGERGGQRQQQGQQSCGHGLAGVLFVEHGSTS